MDVTGRMPVGYNNGSKGHQAPSHEASSKGKSASNNGDGVNTDGIEGTARMLGNCRIVPGSDDSGNSGNIDVGPTQLEVDMHDALVGATGVQFTEQVGVEVEPGMPYSRRGILGEVNTTCVQSS